MSDIVERLRAPSSLMTKWTHIALAGEAAEEIERLRAEIDHLKQARSDALAGGDALRDEIERLRAGLQKIVDADGWWDAPSIARDLLEGRDVT